VVVGITDGTFTEVKGEGLREGVEVIIDEEGGDASGMPGAPGAGGGRRTPRLF
jgi:hypothetical protein